MQYRATGDNLSVNDGDSLVLEGYFILFDNTTELYPKVYEKISRDALGDIKQKDIKALFNHDTSVVLGRTKNKTLDISVDDVGLYATIKINKEDSEALNVYQKVKRGDIDQCSFGFVIEKQHHERVDGKDVFVVDKLDLKEISVVTFPAYEDTSVKARAKSIRKKQVLEFKDYLKGRLRCR